MARGPLWKRNLFNTFGSEPKQQKASGKVSHTRGAVSKSDRAVVEALILNTPGDLTDAQVEALEVLLGRQRRTIVKLIDTVRDKLARNAERYADLHLLTAEKAFELADADPKALETARRAAEFALSKISTRDDKGNVHRIIDDSQAQSSNVPTLRIGIALGGMRKDTRATQDDVTDAEIVTQDDVTS